MTGGIAMQNADLPERVKERLAFAASRSQCFFYLGSFPSLIPTEAEFHRELDIDRKATRRRLMLYVDHDRKGTKRRYVYVQHGRINESIDYRPDVSDLVFGELETKDSEGYVAKEPPLMFQTWDYCPMPLIGFPVEQRIPEGGDALIVAKTPARCCGEPVGYGRIFYEGNGGYDHKDCVGEDLKAELEWLQSLKPEWKPTKDLPKPKQRVAA
jgi:hypothetical protein